MKRELICAHWIEYWFNEDENKELDESSIEHIQNLLKENYVEGELCQYDDETETEYYGWWKIKK